MEKTEVMGNMNLLRKCVSICPPNYIYIFLLSASRKFGLLVAERSDSSSGEHEYPK